MFGKKQTDTAPASSSEQVAPAKRQEPTFLTEMVNAMPSFSLSDKPDVFFTDPSLETLEYQSAKHKLTELLLEKVDFAGMDALTEDGKKARIRDAAGYLLYHDVQVPLTAAQVSLLKEQAVHDLLGVGPIEVLMKNQQISDIMINGYNRVYIEKDGKILLTDVTFTSERHLLNVIQKIVSIVGRRIDESSPMVDARMPDGSRFNAIIPPLALDGCLVSIRKFRKQKIALEDYVTLGSMSEAMQRFLSICGQIRLNIIVSGGTGSGKTTLLNALSGTIGRAERIVTIEDAAELQLQQPHVLRMESRPPNMEGVGEVTQRQLLRNALRMRPDRIIIGEIRGEEVIEVLSAMNTGHDGSMATMHANSPRDALSRIENLVGMSSVKMSLPSLRSQIASAVHLIIQVARLRDGKRRVIQIEEVMDLKDDTIITQTLFGFRPSSMNNQGALAGEYFATGVTPRFLSQAAYYGLENELMSSLKE